MTDSHSHGPHTTSERTWDYWGFTCRRRFREWTTPPEIRSALVAHLKAFPYDFPQFADRHCDATLLDNAWWCGYVRLDDWSTNHVDVFTMDGLTYDGDLDGDGLRWIGFDCLHHGDPQELRDEVFITKACERLVRQIRRVSDAARAESASDDDPDPIAL